MLVVMKTGPGKQLLICSGRMRMSKVCQQRPVPGTGAYNAIGRPAKTKARPSCIELIWCLYSMAVAATTVDYIYFAHQLQQSYFCLVVSVILTVISLAFTVSVS